jgi:translation initiation factor 2B subunit (eIF-2B alpha/beta/delta family)
VCGVVNIHRVEICCIGSRGTAREFVSVSQVIFTPIVVFIEKIRPHPTSLSKFIQLRSISKSRFSGINTNFDITPPDNLDMVTFEFLLA